MQMVPRCSTTNRRLLLSLAARRPRRFTIPVANETSLALTGPGGGGGGGLLPELLPPPQFCVSTASARTASRPAIFFPNRATNLSMAASVPLSGVRQGGHWSGVHMGKIRKAIAPCFDPLWRSCYKKEVPAFLPQERTVATLLLSSSMAEHPAVNRRVVGSSPT